MGSDLQTVCHEAHEGKEPCILFLIIASSRGSSSPARSFPKIITLLSCGAEHIISPLETQNYAPCLRAPRPPGVTTGNGPTLPLAGEIRAWEQLAAHWLESKVCAQFLQGCFHSLSPILWSRSFLQSKAPEHPDRSKLYSSLFWQRH